MSCDKNPEKIKSIFKEISNYYDIANNIISFGTHYIIKFLALCELDIKPRSMVLDLCCGTGDFTRLVLRYFPNAKIIGLDFSEEMLKKAKTKNPHGVFTLGDCTKLPFEPNEFDYITISFGLRNIKDRKKAISEMYRVLDKGGKLLHLDFGEHNKISKAFNLYVKFTIAIYKIFKFIFRKKITLFENLPQNYLYLLSSKDEFPAPDNLIQEFEQSGFKYVKKVNYLFGAISAQIFQK